MIVFFELNRNISFLGWIACVPVLAANMAFTLFNSVAYYKLIGVLFELCCLVLILKKDMSNPIIVILVISKNEICIPDTLIVDGKDIIVATTTRIVEKSDPLI